eukprot:72013_1
MSALLPQSTTNPASSCHEQRYKLQQSQQRTRNLSSASLNNHVVDEILFQYQQQNKHKPKNAADLMLFSIQNQHAKTLTLNEAKQIYDKSQYYVPSDSNMYKIQISYKDKIFMIPVYKSTPSYTIKDLQNELSERYVNEPVSSLTFKLHGHVVYQFDKNIMKYFKTYNTTTIKFDVELSNKDKQMFHRSISQTILKLKNSQTDWMKTIKNEFHEAYFTKNDHLVAYFNEFGDEDQKINLQKKNNANLNEGISNILTSEQNKTFSTVIEKFENKIQDKLEQHQQLESKVKSGDKNSIKSHLNIMMHERKLKIEQQYKFELEQLKEYNNKMNILWEKSQKIQQSDFKKGKNFQLNETRIKRHKYQQNQFNSLKKDLD